jgi:2-amino-4-hydroxy-6-hydroxymethyldihydropteridine diphosphokinase
MQTIYIGIGSNLEQPLLQVKQAMNELGQLAGCQLLAVSRLYKSRPLTIEDQTSRVALQQPDYTNAVVAIRTERDAVTVLDDCQMIENQHGRIRGEQRWGPRTLDLDLLLVDDKIINQPRLIIPHPGLHQRSFVLYPLQEIAPDDLIIPGHGRLQDLVAQCDDEGLERLSNP